MGISPKNILVYRLGSLGDTVIALPVFHKIRETYPDAHITLLTNQPVASMAAPLESILGSHYFYDKVLVYPVGTRSVKVLFDLIKQIRALRIDTLIYLVQVRTLSTRFKTKLNIARDWWFFKAAGIKKMIGFPTELPDLELVADPETGEWEWEAYRLARRVKEIGAIPLDDDRYWDMKFTPEELAAGEKAMAEIIPDTPVIAASIGTKATVKDWEEHNWVSLLKQLRLKLPHWQLVMLGAHGEFAQAETCIAAWGGPAVNLCGFTSPRVSGVVMQHAQLFLGHDSGPMHLAAAVGTPCVAIFAARHLPRQWFPRGDFNKIIYHRTDCAGCGLDDCIVQKKKCILSITVDEVEKAVMEIASRKQINA